jgi:hypothetical protein
MRLKNARQFFSEDLETKKKNKSAASLKGAGNAALVNGMEL